MPSTKGRWSTRRGPVVSAFLTIAAAVFLLMSVLPLGASADDAYEPDGTIDLAKPILLDQPQERWLAEGDTDWVSFGTEHGVEYVLRASRPSADAETPYADIAITDAAGAYLASSYDSPLMDGVPFSGTGESMRASVTEWDDYALPYRLTLSRSGHIAGSVRSSTGLGITTAVVIAYYFEFGEWDYMSHAYTESDGSYRLSGLPAGDYKVEFYDYTEFYRTEFWDDALALSEATTVTVGAGVGVGPLDAIMDIAPATGSIFGTVVSELNQAPIAAVDVTVLIREYYWSDLTPVATTQTDEWGEYWFDDVPTGEIYLHFVDGSREYVSEYWDNSPTKGGAVPQLLVGGHILECNAALSRTGSISGSVVDFDTAAQLDSVTVGLWLGYQDPKRDAPIAKMVTSGDGWFTFDRLLQNDYLIGLTGPDGTDYLPEKVNVRLDTSQDYETQVRLVRPSSLAGMIVDEVTHEPVADAYVAVVPATGYGGGSTRTDASGAWAYSGLRPGAYRLSVGGPASSSYLATDTGVVANITAGGTHVTGLVTPLARISHVTGTVTSEITGGPLSGINVIAHAYYEQGSGWANVGAATTAADGTFDLALNEGTYRISFGHGSDYALEHWGGVAIDEARDIAVPRSSVLTRIDAALTRGATLSGWMTNAETGQKVEGSTSLYRWDEGTQKWLKAGGKSQPESPFTYSQLYPGRYRLGGISHYRMGYYPSGTCVEDAGDIVLAAGQALQNVALKTYASTLFDGFVRDAQGNPVAGATMELYQWRPTAGVWTLARSVSSYNTPGWDRGRYQLWAPGSGKFRIRASAAGYSPQWNGGAVFAEDAEQLYTGNTANTVNRDFTLRDVASVTGTVSVLPALGAGQLQAHLYEMDWSKAWRKIESVAVPSGGAFSFAKLSAGRAYTVSFTEKNGVFPEIFLGMARHPDDAARIVAVSGGRHTATLTIGGPDTFAPVTRVSGIPTSWTNKTVDIRFVARDIGLSGVAQSWYKLGAGPVTPLASTVPVSAEGITQLEFWSIDTSGNVESPRKTATVRIDKSAPTVACAGTVPAVFESKASINLAASDSLSGVAKVEWRLDGGSWQTGKTITASEPGSHRAEYRATDVAGNTSSTKSVAFTVIWSTKLYLQPPDSPNHGAAVQLQAKLTQKPDVPLAGKSVKLEYWTGSAWSSLGYATTDQSGWARWKGDTKATPRTYRVRFKGAPYQPSVSSSRRVKRYVALSRPYAPDTMRKGRSYLVTGTLKPKHKSGTYPVRIYKWKKRASGSWKSYGYVRARVKTKDAKTSTYYSYLSLPTAGTWRLRAFAPSDSKHAETWAGKSEYVKVK